MIHYVGIGRCDRQDIGLQYRRRVRLQEAALNCSLSIIYSKWDKMETDSEPEVLSVSLHRAPTPGTPQSDAPPIAPAATSTIGSS
ncbi:hypothetical protein GGR58DRAFT_138902 [Xylaria digitata]|nr:hypothetical protein GGR58DRAFT_138902 [Xylaria digitata]